MKAPPAPQVECKNALGRKRALIWHNDRRNQRIADLAKGIQYGWRKKMTTQQLLDKSQTQAVFHKQHLSVAILVENIEHGAQLQRLLPSWDLLTRHSVTGCIPTVGGRQIASMSYAQDFGVGTDVLIRADGGVDWPLSAPAFPQASLSPDEVVVVDFEDSGSKRLRRTAQRLRRVYRERGWNIVGHL